MIITDIPVYDGLLIHKRFAYNYFRKKTLPIGNIVAFRAPMNVQAEGMIDSEDVLQNDYIYSDDAINFCWEIPYLRIKFFCDEYTKGSIVLEIIFYHWIFLYKIKEKMNAMIVKQHIPNFILGFKRKENYFKSIEELSSIDWISVWSKQSPRGATFYQYSIDKEGENRCDKIYIPYARGPADSPRSQPCLKKGKTLRQFFW